MIKPSLSHPVTNAAIIVAAIAGATGVVYRELRHMGRSQSRTQRGVRELTRLQLTTLDARQGEVEEELGEPSDEAVVAAILAEIEAGPYVRHHIRPDLPATVEVLEYETADGPVTITRPDARPRTAARYRATLRGFFAAPIVMMDGACRAIGTTFSTTTSTAVAATTQATGAVTVTAMAVMPISPACADVRPPSVTAPPASARSTGDHVPSAWAAPIALAAPPKEPQADQADREAQADVTPTPTPTEPTPTTIALPPDVQPTEEEPAPTSAPDEPTETPTVSPTLTTAPTTSPSTKPTPARQNANAGRPKANAGRHGDGPPPHSAAGNRPGRADRGR